MWTVFASLDYKALGTQVLANSAIIGVAGWIAKSWAERRLEAIKGAQSRKLEETKGDIERITSRLNAGLEKRKLVFETHLNLEFSSYQELWSYCDECYVIANQTLGYIQREPVDDAAWEEEKDEVIVRYDQCREIYTSIRRLRPFIKESVADQSIELARVCLRIASMYKDVYLADMKSRKRDERNFDRKPFIKGISTDLKVASSTYDDVAELISNRIDKLYIADFGEG